MVFWALLNVFNYHRQASRYPLEHWIIYLWELSTNSLCSSNVWSDRRYISQLLPCNILPSVTPWSNTSLLSSVIWVAPHNQTLSISFVANSASICAQQVWHAAPFQESLQQPDTVKKSSIQCRHLHLQRRKNSLCPPHSQKDWYGNFFAWDSIEPLQHLSWDETNHARDEYLPH